MKKRFGVMFLVLAYFLLIGSTYFFAKPIGNIILDDTEIKEDSNDEIESENNEDVNQDFGIQVYSVYSEYYESYRYSFEKSKDSYTLDFTIPTENVVAKGIDISDNGSYFLYSDEYLKIFDRNSEKVIDTNIVYNQDASYGSYRIFENDKNELIGFSTDNGFYNAQINKLMYKNEFMYENEPNRCRWNYEVDNYLTVNCHGYNYLVLSDTEKVVMSAESGIEDPTGYYFDVISGIKGNYILKINESEGDSPQDFEFYNENLRKIIPSKLVQYYFDIKEGYLYANINNKLYKYDELGNRKLLKSFDEIITVYDGESVVAVNNNNLVYSSNKCEIELMNWKPGYVYDDYYTLVASYDNKLNVYIIIERNNDTYKYKVINLNTETCEFEITDDEI